MFCKRTFGGRSLDNILNKYLFKGNSKDSEQIQR